MIFPHYLQKHLDVDNHFKPVYFDLISCQDHHPHFGYLTFNFYLILQINLNFR